LKNVPTFALFRESGKTVPARARSTRCGNFNYGLIVPGEGMTGNLGMSYDAKRPDPCPADASGDPRAAAHWRVGERSHAWCRGRRKTNDTAAIQKAIETHRVLYFPSGHYMVK
jgi:hypothetical protein